MVQKATITKFNDIVNSLEQQGHTMEPKVLKGNDFGKIKEKVYKNINYTAAALESTTLADVHAQILQKH